MWKRAFILMISAALLLVSGAEAVTGHCSKTAAVSHSAELSAHCADMMSMATETGQHEQSDPDSGACCCVITSAPVLFDLPFPGAPSIETLIWSRPIDTSGQSVPEKVAIPPPKL